MSLSATLAITQELHRKAMREIERLEAHNAELLAACKAGIEKLEVLGHEHNRTGQIMYEAIDKAIDKESEEE